MPSSPGSVSIVIDDLKKGDRVALARLWNRYFDSLVRQTRWRLKVLPHLAADDEDVALSAFDTFFRALEDNRFPDLQDRNDLWQILVMLAGRKARKRIKKENAKKRGGGQVITHGDLKEVLSHEPTPAEAAEFADGCERLIAQLKSRTLTEVAEMKLEGFTNVEIATKIARSVRTVEHRLETIRDIWMKVERP